jgi:OOP family OmpA-OmpF porin
MKFRNALVAATILALPIAAKAQPVTGVYVGAGAGIDFLLDPTVKGNINNGAFTFQNNKLNPKVGPAFDLAVGYGFGNGLRAELEGFYSYNTFSGNHQGGTEQKAGPMVNVLYDFMVSPAIQPYVGVGVGYIWAQERNLHSSGTATLPAGYVVNGTALTSSITGNANLQANNAFQGSFAAQAIIGAAFPIASVPGLALTADYRFLSLSENRTYSGTASGTLSSSTRTATVTVPASYRLTNDYNNIVMVGVRYAFGAAPPPPPPAPAPVPPSPVSRSYLVFFDWDKAVLTDRARQIVAEAAAASTKVQYTKLEVNGYTDTSGTPAYNQGLSIRRAQAVAAELVKDGVPKAAISIQGFGETHLLVQTGPGVREPQNRRVEIIIK